MPTFWSVSEFSAVDISLYVTLRGVFGVFPVSFEEMALWYQLVIALLLLMIWVAHNCSPLFYEDHSVACSGVYRGRIIEPPAPSES